MAQELSGVDGLPPELERELETIWLESSPRRSAEDRAMEGRSAVSQAIGRFLIDPHFRSMYGRDPRATVENAGLSLSAFEFTVLSEVAGQLRRYAEDPAVRRLSERMIGYEDRVKI